MPATVGAALAFKMRGQPRVAIAFFGDGDASLDFAQAGTDPKPKDALNYVYAPTPAIKAPSGGERQR